MMMAAGRTDIGSVRHNNEDSIFFSCEKIFCLPNLFVVADGIGGHNAGEVASSKAIECFKGFLENGCDNMLDSLVQAVEFSNARVFQSSLENDELSGMGTTFTACVISDKLYTVHIGDSRLYRFSDGKLCQLTEDHTFVNEMVKKGELTLEEARNHKNRNLITRALGTDNVVDVDAFVCDIKSGDLILLCSDGLTDMVSDEEISQILSRGDSVETFANNLIDKALKNGGADNISVIVSLCESGVGL